MLGSRQRMSVEAGLSHSTNVAVNSLIKGVQQPTHIVSRFEALQSVESNANCDMIILPRGIFAAPAIEAITLIKSMGSRSPLLIANRLFQRTLKLEVTGAQHRVTL